MAILEGGAQGLKSEESVTAQVQGKNRMLECENSLPNWKTGTTSSQDEEVQDDIVGISECRWNTFGEQQLL